VPGPSAAAPSGPPAGDPRVGAPGSEDQFARGSDAAADGDGGARSGAEPGSGGATSDPVAQPTMTTSTTTELEEQRERYLRLAAEYDNYRKRSQRERQEAGARAQADLVKRFIDALDDLARFAHLDPATADAATVVQGVDMVERKLLKALVGAGVQVINPIDQAFDPNLHEAVSTERALSPEDDHLVARVFQPGYLFGGQLLRPARVVVKQWNG